MGSRENSAIHNTEIVNRKITNFNKIDTSPMQNKVKEGLVGIGQDNW
jgi:hypothetical protein